jgi:hypothetical protein
MFIFKRKIYFELLYVVNGIVLYCRCDDNASGGHWQANTAGLADTANELWVKMKATLKSN